MSTSQSAPLILLTNDDGIESPYLRVMADSLVANLRAEVLVIAPERQRSAMSQAITLHKPLRFTEHSVAQSVNSTFFAVSGTPADCVYVGIMKIAHRMPDLVISGPNDGYNLGTDVFYSGTVGAAIEGGLRGISSIAVSVAPQSPDAVPVAAELVCGLAEHLLGQGGKAAAGARVLNVNVPKDSGEKMRWTRLGKRFYEDDVHERTDPRNRRYYWIGGGMAGIADIPGSDCEAVINEGIASVSPMHLDLTEHSELNEPGTIRGFSHS